MRKLLIAFILIPVFSSGQTRIEKDTLFVNDTLKIIKGQSIEIGQGSNVETKDFNFIFTKPTVLVREEMKLPSSWTGLKMTVKDFKVYKSKKFGDKYYLILGGGNIVNYMCDILPAIKYKEIIL